MSGLTMLQPNLPPAAVDAVIRCQATTVPTIDAAIAHRPKRARIVASNDAVTSSAAPRSVQGRRAFGRRRPGRPTASVGVMDWP